jgi:hypothetical protein
MLDNILSGNFTDREIFFLEVLVITLPLTILGFKFFMFMFLPKFLMKKTLMKNYHDLAEKRQKRSDREAKKRKRSSKKDF